ncbi:MAG TPA: hypothetical protein VGQ84_03865 [Gaiellaceae bacterium]|jgi:hypothetical protein|nr:hypothetical protein [Gaiellaceae bacterium]
MVELEILIARDQQGDEAAWAPLARLRVDDRHVEVEGDQTVIDFRLPLVSLRTGTQVRFEDDHEEWARSLPTAFRAGDVIVRVLHDDNPIRESELRAAQVERHQVRLRERLGQHVS